MPSIPNISFSARFDLTGVPTLILTDTSTNGLTSTRVAAFDITQPDLYTRTGNILSPDMAAGVTTFSIALRLDSNGLPQCGTYNIVMTVKNTGYDNTTFTRNWVSQYVPVTLTITNNFDVFTPNLSVTDSTTYAVSNYNNGAITRAWNITSAATGTLTGSGVTKSFIYSGKYYESNYTISLTSSLLYTHQVYTWFTVNESLSKTYTACIDAPPSVTELVSSISDLKTELNEAVNTCQTYDNIKADFEYAESLFMHIIDKIKTNDMDSIFTDLNDLLTVLANHQIPACNPTNIIIPPYDLSLYSSVTWGSIGGSIVNQTDVNLGTVTTNGSVTTNKITVGGVGLTGMTSGTGALYYNAGANRVTVANYNSGGSVVFEVNGGQYSVTLNPDLSVRLMGYTTNGFLKTSGSNGTLVVDSASYVPTTRTLTINGTAYDLSADRSWTINSMVYPSAGIAVSTGSAWGTSIVDNSSNWNDAYSYRITSATSPLSITSNVISISQSSGSVNGYLSSTDWTTFNSKVGGSGTTNYIPKFTGSSTIGNSLIYDNGTTVAIGTTSPLSDNKLQVEGRIASNVSSSSTTTSVYSIVGSTLVTYPAGGSLSGSVVVNGVQGGISYTFGGNLSVPNSVPTASVIAVSGVQFTGTGTVTVSQAGTGIRSLSNLYVQWQSSGNVSGTISHIANIRSVVPYSASSGTLSITNYYAFLIEDSSQFAPISITNKWGIYQEGINDKNYFAGSIGIGTNSLGTNALRVVGSVRLTALAGTGTRAVVADTNGELSTQAITSANETIGLSFLLMGA
jgi:hypothetical protein